MVILTEKEAKQYRELEALLKKVGIDLEKLTVLLNSFDIINSSIKKFDTDLALINKRVQDLEVNKKMTTNPSPKEILSELMGAEVPKINEEI